MNRLRFLAVEDINCLTVYNTPFLKVRVGSSGDGGYVIADGLEYDSFISCGIETNIDFEKEFLLKHPTLICYAFDGTIQSLPEDVDRMKFIKKNIAPRNSDVLTNLHEFINPYSNIFLKMDIESHEFEWFNTLTDKQIQSFKQIVIEFHFPYKQRHRMGVLNKLASTHWLIHIHANNCCGTSISKNAVLPNVFECTYIRKDLQPFYGFNTQEIPSSIDSANIPNKPEIVLNYKPFFFG